LLAVDGEVRDGGTETGQYAAQLVERGWGLVQAFAVRPGMSMEEVHRLLGWPDAVEVCADWTAVEYYSGSGLRLSWHCTPWAIDDDEPLAAGWVWFYMLLRAVPSCEFQAMVAPVLVELNPRPTLRTVRWVGFDVPGP
jgi:hypothetical protein